MKRYWLALVLVCMLLAYLPSEAQIIPRGTATASNPGRVAPRDNLTVDSAGIMDWTPADTTTAWLKDEFPGNSKTSLSIGELGWRYTATTSCTPLTIVGALPNPGILRLTTGAAATNGCALDLEGVDTLGPLGLIGAASNVEQHFIFKTANTTDVSLRIGYVLGTHNGAVEPTDGVWLRYEKNTSAGGNTQTSVNAVEDAGRTTATYTTATAHGYKVGDTVTTSGCSNANFSLSGAITVVTATTFAVATAVPTGGATSTTCTAKVADTTFKFETRKTSVSDSYDTGQAPNTSNFYHLRIRNLASGKVGLTLYDNTGAVLVAEKTFCAAGCTVTSSNVNTASSMAPAFLIFSATGGGGAAVALQIDFYGLKIRGLAR